MAQREFHRLNNDIHRYRAITNLRHDTPQAFNTTVCTYNPRRVKGLAYYRFGVYQSPVNRRMGDHLPLLHLSYQSKRVNVIETRS